MFLPISYEIQNPSEKYCIILNFLNLLQMFFNRLHSIIVNENCKVHKQIKTMENLSKLREITAEMNVLSRSDGSVVLAQGNCN
jgi:hypothetical protein